MLLMEFHGSPAGVKEQAETVQELASGHGGNAFEWATTPEERTRLWTARHNAYFAAVQSRPGCRAISTDTCVPISRLADCLLESVAEADASGIPYFLVGHVGDGNFHFGYLIDPDDARGARQGRGAQPRAGVARHRAGRHLQRRARHRPAQDGLPGRRGRCRRGRHDAHHQARARPEEHHEPGQDLQLLSTAPAASKSPAGVWRAGPGPSIRRPGGRGYLFFSGSSVRALGAFAPPAPRSATAPRRHPRSAGRRRPGPGPAPSAPCSCAARRPSG